MPCQPTKRGSFRDASCHSGVCHLPAFGLHPCHQQGSTLWCQTRILVDVHPGASGIVGRIRNPSFTRWPRVNNLHSFHS